MKTASLGGLSLAVLILVVGRWDAAQAEGADRARVHLLSTGGTIAGGPQGPLTAANLVERAPELARTAEITFEDFLRIGSSRITPELQLSLARRVQEIFAKDRELAGIVITHGTDTLEETAFLLDLLVDDERPVVFAAAQRPPREVDSDGPRNLLNAVRIAASAVSRGAGVVVTLNGEIHGARDVRKTHSIALDSFRSPGVGPLGYLDGPNVVFTARPARRLHLKAETVETRVDLLTLVAGSDGRLIDASVASGARGLVLETFGRGNVPEAAMAAVARARKHGVVVVFTTRTRGGRVEVDPSAREIGVIGAEDLDGLKARMLLVAALPATKDPVLIQGYYERLSGLRK
jgi:L-asparaginase